MNHQFDASRVQRFGIEGIPSGGPAVLKEKFVAPLYALLVEYARTGEARYRDVYLDERLRYAPHRAAREVRTAFFNEVLALDEATLRAAVSARDRDVLDQVLNELHGPLLRPLEGTPLRVFALGDCLMNEVRVAVNAGSFDAGIPLDYRMLYFSSSQGRALDETQALRSLEEQSADLIALSFLSYKGIAPFALLLKEADRLSAREVEVRVEQLLGLMRGFLDRLRAHTDAPFLLHNVSGLPLDPVRRRLPLVDEHSSGVRSVLEALNRGVEELARQMPKVVLIDEDRAARERGLRECDAALIPAKIARNALFHTAQLGHVVAPQYLDVLQSYRTLAKAKVLCLDFDNTLWDGVMAEGPVVQRHGLQQRLRKLREAGLLLVSVSKNDPKNIRWDEMSLKPDDFVLHKIGWDLKAKSIEEAARALDLGLDSFVLLDDNPVERALVARELPKVKVMNPLDARTETWLERALTFPNVRQTEESKRRTELYREQVARKDALSQTGFDYPAMMASLGLKVRFGPAKPGELDRIAELVQRTNQFNTTTIRYDRNELARMMASADHGVYTASLADRFGSVGLVAVAIVRRDGRERIIESFVMSCRAMGFELERYALRAVIDAESAEGVTFVGRFAKSDRNQPASTLYASNGFTSEEGGRWVLEPGAVRPEKPTWFEEQ